MARRPGPRLRKWNSPTLGPRPFTTWKGPLATVPASKTTPILRDSVSHGSTDVGTATMVLTVPDCYPDDLLIAFFTTGGLATVTSTAGLAFTNAVVFGPGATNTLQYLSRRASASSDGGLSTDAGSTATFTVSDTTQKWLGTMVAIGGAHRTYATAMNQAVQTTGGTITSLAVTGGTASVANGLQLTVGSYGASSAGNSNTFARELTQADGQVEYLFDQTSVTGGSVRGRALAIWRTNQSPINGTLQATRTMTMAGLATGGMSGLSLTIAPMLAEAGDNFWDVPAAQAMSDSTIHRMDVLLPATGTAPSTGWPWVIYIHGGVSGNKKLTVGTEDAVLALLASPYDCAVISVHFRGVGASQPTNTGIERVQDIQGTLRYLRNEACARYGLDTRYFVGFGSSAGASLLAGNMLNPNSSLLTVPEMGCAGGDATFDACLLWMPESNMAAVDTQFTALGIARSQTPAETAGSTEELHLVGYANLTYSGTWQGVKHEPRFDATDFPMTGSPANDTTQNRYNIRQAQYWADGRDQIPIPKSLNVRISHGNLDDQVPVLQSYNDGSGVGSTSPTGLYQKLVHAGFPVVYNQNTGANHDMATLYWKPSTYVGALAGAFVDADLLWLSQAAKGQVPDSDSRISRRRRSIIRREST